MADVEAQTSRVQSVAIEGLEDWQCEDLVVVQKGSLLEVAVFSQLRSRERDGSGEGSEPSEDDNEQKEDVDDQAEANDDNNTYDDQENVASAETSGESSEVSEPDTPPMPNTTNFGSKWPDTNSEEMHQALEEDPPVLTHFKTLPDGTSSSDLSVDDSLRLHTSPGRPHGQAEMQDNAEAYGGQIENQGPNMMSSGRQPGELLHGQTADGDDREKTGEKDDASDNEEASEDTDEDERARGSEYSEDEDGGEELWRDLYVVLDVKTADDNNAAVIDLKLRKLTYQHRGEEANFDTYRIYGNAVTLHNASTTLVEGEEPIFLREIVDSEEGNTFSITLNPSGDYLRDMIFDHRCPANCNNGWLQDLQALRAVHSGHLPDVRPFRPICPVCVGKILMTEQVTLRYILDTANYVDIGQVVEHLGKLNPRRRELGYAFVQFDEREWGYGFDDMLDESDDEDVEGRGDEGRFEHWDEAMDPNANPRTRPASEDTIAALPKKKYEDVARKEGDAVCAICQEDGFGEESLVVELPCGHVYDAGCLEAWIREYDNCPECRATVSGMVESKDKNPAERGNTGEKNEVNRDVEDDLNNEAVLHGRSDGNYQDLRVSKAVGTIQDDDAESAEALEMDGEDVVMSDVEEAVATYSEEL